MTCVACFWAHSTLNRICVTCLCGPPCSLPSVTRGKQRWECQCCCACVSVQPQWLLCLPKGLRSHIWSACIWYSHPCSGDEPETSPLSRTMAAGAGTPANSSGAGEAQRKGDDPTDPNLSPGFITQQLGYFNSELHFPYLENGNINPCMSVLWARWRSCT